MKNEKVMFSKNSDNWKTPTNIYNAFMQKGYRDCFQYQSKENELNNLYIEQRLFVNPPFSKMNQILYWLLDQIGNNNKVALLIPSRTDTFYFHELAKEKPIIIFIKGRLKYNDTGCAPFPTILMLFNYEEKNEYTTMTQEELIELIKSL